MRDGQPDEQQDYLDHPEYATGSETQRQSQQQTRTSASLSGQESSFLLAVSGQPGQPSYPQDTLSSWDARSLWPPVTSGATNGATNGSRMRRTTNTTNSPAQGAAKGSTHGRPRQGALPDEAPDDQRDPLALARSTTVLPPLGDHDDTALALEVAGQQRFRRARRSTNAPAGQTAETAEATQGSAPGEAGGRALMRTPGAADRQVAIAHADGEGAALLIRGAARAPRMLGRVVPRRRGSFTSQFIVAMLSAMLVASVLTLATPLGQSAVFGNTFRAYANAVPIVPTPTPTLVPTATPAPPGGGYNPGQRVIINYIISVFGPYAQGALNVSHCESDYDPNAVNPFPIGNSHASGVFQILYPSTWDTTSYAGYSPFDYQANIRAAYQIFSRDGYSWREWQCQP